MRRAPAPSAGTTAESGAAGSPRKPQRATPRNVVGQGPLVAAPGLRLGIVVIVRNEAPYLEEWLGYHVALGVDHVFLYDNGSDDDLAQVVERHVNHGLLTLVHWPLPGGQIDAYSHALRFFGPSVDWLAFIDVDEFIVPLVDDDLPTFLDRFPDAADIRIPRVDFGFSGHRTPPAGLTIDAYTGVADVFGRDPSLAASREDRRPVSRRLGGRHPHRDPRGRADRARRAARAHALGAVRRCATWPRSTTTTRARSRSSRPSDSEAARPGASRARPSRSTCRSCARTTARDGSSSGRRR